MCETSNIEEYTPEQLSLLIECIQEKIDSLQAVSTFTEMLIHTSEDISESLEINLRTQITKRSTKIDDLYGLRVAMMNAHQIVMRKERVTES